MQLESVDYSEDVELHLLSEFDVCGTPQQSDNEILALSFLEEPSQLSEASPDTNWDWEILPKSTATDLEDATIEGNTNTRPIIPLQQNQLEKSATAALSSHQLEHDMAELSVQDPWGSGLQRNRPGNSSLLFFLRSRGIPYITQLADVQ